MDLVSLVVILLVVGIILYAINQIKEIDGKIKRIINVLVVAVVLLWLLGIFFPQIHAIRIGRCP